MTPTLYTMAMTVCLSGTLHGQPHDSCATVQRDRSSFAPTSLVECVNELSPWFTRFLKEAGETLHLRPEDVKAVGCAVAKPSPDED